MCVLEIIMADGGKKLPSIHCSKCSLKYNGDTRTPRTLPCNHTLCQRCIQDILDQSEGQLKCPLCGKQHEVPCTKDADAYPLNEDKLGIIRLLQENEKEKKPKRNQDQNDKDSQSRSKNENEGLKDANKEKGATKESGKNEGTAKSSAKNEGTTRSGEKNEKTAKAAEIMREQQEAAGTMTGRQEAAERMMNLPQKAALRMWALQDRQVTATTTSSLRTEMGITIKLKVSVKRLKEGHLKSMSSAL